MASGFVRHCGTRTGCWLCSGSLADLYLSRANDGFIDFVVSGGRGGALEAREV